jgi:hypothetical protein
LGLILTITAGAGAVAGAAVVKIIADDSKEWTSWLARRLLNIAVRRLPEGRRERYAEEWAAHLAEVPGVIGKLAVSLQFQIAAFRARELEARAHLEAWNNKFFAAAVKAHAIAHETSVWYRAQGPMDAEDEARAQERMLDGLVDIVRVIDEAEDERPALGITVTNATLLVRDFIRDVRVWVLMPRVAAYRRARRRAARRGRSGSSRRSPTGSAPMKPRKGPVIRLSAIPDEPHREAEPEAEHDALHHRPGSEQPKRSAIVEPKRKRASVFGDAPDLTEEEHQRRGDAADALFREIVRRAVGNA